jgi:hypothetical protein
MKCNCTNNMIEQIQKLNPDIKNICPPKEFFSGRLYLNFTGERTVRGKEKKVDIPILLSKCPFCGEKYDELESNKFSTRKE